LIISVKLAEKLIQREYPDFEFTLFSDTPVTPLTKLLNECKLALVTTGGLHLKTDHPFDFSIKAGDSSYRMLPGDMTHNDIQISHMWYDHKFINEDLNCVFPIDRMREYVKEGKIKSLSEEHYSFMGHIFETGPLIENSRIVGQRLRELGVDIAFLTPT